MGTVERRLGDLGLDLPTPARPVANYVPVTRTGALVFVSGQLPLGPSGVEYRGKLGETMDIEAGARAARLCAVNLVAQLKGDGIDLDRVRVIKLTGFVNSAPGFTDHPKVVNGASDLLVAIFGDDGRHARSAVGVAGLPMDAAVEVEGIFEIR